MPAIFIMLPTRNLREAQESGRHARGVGWARLGKQVVMACVIDTNPLIYFLGGAVESSVLSGIETAIRTGAQFSVISRIEVFGWPGYVPALRSSCPMPSLPPAHWSPICR
jgi:hypothetical protein